MALYHTRLPLSRGFLKIKEKNAQFGASGPVGGPLVGHFDLFGQAAPLGSFVLIVFQHALGGASKSCTQPIGLDDRDVGIG